tara:strand:+ start:228 stop:467 length:240 start_codon:yes stop_codon:yes gene_type:complete
MKKELKEVDVDYSQIEVDCSPTGIMEYKVVFFCKKYPGENEDLKLFVNKFVPETLKDFRELHGLSKEELVEWLNNNYEQ